MSANRAQAGALGPGDGFIGLRWRGSGEGDAPVEAPRTAFLHAGVDEVTVKSAQFIGDFAKDIPRGLSQTICASVLSAGAGINEILLEAALHRLRSRQLGAPFIPSRCSPELLQVSVVNYFGKRSSPGCGQVAGCNGAFQVIYFLKSIINKRE